MAESGDNPASYHFENKGNRPCYQCLESQVVFIFLRGCYHEENIVYDHLCSPHYLTKTNLLFYFSEVQYFCGTLRLHELGMSSRIRSEINLYL